MPKIIAALALVLAACGSDPNVGDDVDGGTPDASARVYGGNWVLTEDVPTTCDEYADGLSPGEGVRITDATGAPTVVEWLDGDIGFRDLVFGEVTDVDVNGFTVDVTLGTTEVVEPVLRVFLRAVDFGNDNWFASVRLYNPAGDECGGSIGLNWGIQWTPE